VRDEVRLQLGTQYSAQRNLGEVRQPQNRTGRSTGAHDEGVAEGRVGRHGEDDVIAWPEIALL
jgi:hypothetical protein